jgi:hypothetical protein
VAGEDDDLHNPFDEDGLPAQSPIQNPKTVDPFKKVRRDDEAEFEEDDDDSSSRDV